MRWLEENLMRAATAHADPELLEFTRAITNPVGNAQGGSPACGCTPAGPAKSRLEGAAEGSSTPAAPQDLDSRTVQPPRSKPPASRRRGAPEPSMPRQSEAGLPASLTSQAHGHRNS